MGYGKLITEGASHVFSSGGNSIIRLGLIAIAKLVSPSHMKDSISLYKNYMDFLKEYMDRTVHINDLLRGN